MSGASPDQGSGIGSPLRPTRKHRASNPGRRSLQIVIRIIREIRGRDGSRTHSP